MDIITAPLAQNTRGVLEVFLPVDRFTLAKRRWRGTAEDNREFGFDLPGHLHDGDAFFHEGGTTYIIAQQPEPVYEIPLTTPAEAARLAWLIGNLHFTLEITSDLIRTQQDAALHQMLHREHIHFTETTRVFHPFHQAHSH